jgi:hypothetical protein
MVRDTREYCALESRTCDQNVAMCNSLRNWSTRGLESGRVGDQWAIVRQFSNTLTEVRSLLVVTFVHRTLDCRRWSK